MSEGWRTRICGRPPIAVLSSELHNNWTHEAARVTLSYRRPLASDRRSIFPSPDRGRALTVQHVRRRTMKALKGTKTHDNLKAAFAGESQANRRLPLLRQQGGRRGAERRRRGVRSTAEGETGHAHGHLDYLAQVGDPPPTCRSARRARTSRPPLPAKRTSTPTCIPAWPSRRASERLRRDRRLVRDAGQGRALARQPFPEGARRFG